MEGNNFGILNRRPQTCLHRYAPGPHRYAKTLRAWKHCGHGGTEEKRKGDRGLHGWLGWKGNDDRG